MTGAPIARFDLLDHHGRRVSQADFAGAYLLVYFGFTHCKSVCPRSLAKLSRVLDDLGAAAAAVTPLYVTVDPERDTPERLRAYLCEDYPRFTGLTGSREDIDRAKKNFRVYAEKRADRTEPDGYVVPHTAIAYFMAPGGDYLDHFPDSLEQAEVSARIAAHLERTGVADA